MEKYILCFLGLLLNISSTAQKHDNNWISGYENSSNNYDPISIFGGMRMHFDKGYPEYSRENIRVNCSLYGGTCSDSLGNLIFYTSGFDIRNKNRQIMENGDTINPGYYWQEFRESGYPSVTGSVAIPAPGYSNCYYLFHTTAKDDPSDLISFPRIYYSFIDMNANNGLGKVISKNVVIVEGDVPFPGLVKHGNGRDWWLLIPEFVDKTCLTYLIDPSGIHQLGDQDIISPMLEATKDHGYMAFSADGSRFAFNDNIAGLWLYDFDRCSGLLSNPINISTTYPFFTSSVTFSNSGRFLYLGTNRVIYQLDLSKIDTATYVSMDSLVLYNGGSAPFPPFNTSFFLPQIGPDGKIYYCGFCSCTAGHVIHNPDIPAPVCDFQQGIPLPRYKDATWCYFPEYRLGKMEGSDCDSLGFHANEIYFKNTKPPKQTAYNDIPRVLHFHPDFIQKMKGLKEEEDVLDPGYIAREKIKQHEKEKKHLPSSE
jgi:hypothetical protein